jgi:hypothetical protein
MTLRSAGHVRSMSLDYVSEPLTERITVEIGATLRRGI